MSIVRYVRNKETGHTLPDYALYHHGVGHMFNKVPEGFYLLHKGLPGFNQAAQKQRERLLDEALRASTYYSKTTTRFN